MRNLTIGVLIVTGGTLAALPFRRSSPTIPINAPHLSQSPDQATGTLDSALDLAPVQAVASASGQFQTGSAKPFSAQEIPGLDEFIRDEPPTDSTEFAVIERSPSAVKPLTYEDLMAPITRPETVQDRYQAIAAIGSDSNRQSEEPAMGLPPVGQLAPELRNEFQQRFSSMKPTQIRQPVSEVAESSNRAAGSLASSMIPRTPNLPALSQAPVTAEPSQRQHHWIVQP